MPQLEERLDALADTAPVSALKAVAVLVQVAGRVGKEPRTGLGPTTCRGRGAR
jgi:hypothetical protein